MSLVNPPEMDDRLLFSAYLAKLENDPLQQYRHSCEAARRMVELTNLVKDLWSIEIYWRAGNSCLAGEQEVYDPVLGKMRRVEDIRGPWHVLAWNGTSLEVANADEPYKKSIETLYRVRLSNGQTILCTSAHRVLGADGSWRTLSELLRESGLSLPQSSAERGPSTRGAGGPSSSQTTEGSRAGYLRGHRSCGGQPHWEAAAFQAPAPSRPDVLAGISLESPQAGSGERIRSCQSGDPSKANGSGRLLDPFFHGGVASCSAVHTARRLMCASRESTLPAPESSPGRTATLGGVESLDSRDEAGVCPLTVIDITVLRDAGQVWDFNVHVWHNYLCGGAIHHNSGKTSGGAALGVALARGLTELDGTPLPKLPVPNIGWVLVQTRLQQVDASQAAYLKWIGNWPHKITYVAGEAKGYIEAIYIATAKCDHGTDKRCEKCSKIVFHCAESDSGIGGRIHWAHGDEPPKEKNWDELRARFTAGVPFLKFITATPMERTGWSWLAEQFKNCENTVVDRRVELRSTIHDNRFIVPAQREAIISDWRDSPFFDARLNGDYVDTEGDCPFDVPRLQEWKKRLWVTEPIRKEVNIIAEKTTDAGRIREPRIARYEVWEDPDPEDSYLLIADPSTGVRSKTHDPAGFHIWSRLKRKLVARFNDYLEPYGLGWLIGQVAPLYNNALVDVDMTGGYGAPTITALSADLRYMNINRDYQEHRPGTVGSQLGFKITRENRSEITTAIQRALAEESCIIPSEAVLSCLLGCTVDEQGKYLAAPGRHDEDMICMGRALHLMDTMGKPAKRIITPRERIERLGFIPSRLQEEEDEVVDIVEDAWL